VYEFSTEVLFFGRQDAMQRTSLLPVAEYMQGRQAGDMRLLEVAAGTGRFHTFIKVGVWRCVCCCGAGLLQLVQIPLPCPEKHSSHTSTHHLHQHAIYTAQHPATWLP
jgi:hypothetical protein